MLGVNLHSCSYFAIEAYFIFWIELSRVRPYLCNLSKSVPFLSVLGIVQGLVCTLKGELQKTGQQFISIDSREQQLASSLKLLTLSFLRLMLRKILRMFFRLLLLFPATLFLLMKKQESSQMSPVGMTTSPQLMILTIFQSWLAVSVETCGNWLALKLIQSSYFIYPCAVIASCTSIFSSNCSSSSGNATTFSPAFSSFPIFLLVTCFSIAFFSVENTVLDRDDVLGGVVSIIISIFYYWVAYNNINK